MNNSKADNLLFLKKILKKSHVPKTFVFTVEEWKKNKNLTLDKIQKLFLKDKLIVIRSSSFAEDKEDNSFAGAFESFLNIKTENRYQIKTYIEKVIKSYKKKNNNLKNNQVFIQSMVTNINTSGVAFTKELNTGSSYYVVNYDDVTGLSNSVTSGSGQFSNRTVLFVKNKKKYIKSERFSKLIIAIKEIEKIFQNKSLDIEFIINKKLKIYILQVRYLSTPSIKKNIELKISSHQKKLFKKLKRTIKKNDTNLFGNKTILAQMPDWNPAEIIGKHPNELSSSLYQKLITDKTWLKARKIMGYKSNFKDTPLMYIFSGQPYIDVRKSFNSFLPKKLDKSFGNQLINNWILKLYNKPELHDKVEFEIVSSSYVFDFIKNFKQLNNFKFSNKDLEKFHSHHKELFNNFINPSHPASLGKNVALIKKLEKKIQNYKSDKNLKIKDLNQILRHTINLGTLPFAILARHGFIAVGLINSMLRLKIINLKDKEKFLASFNTVTGDFLNDCKKLKNEELSFTEFKKKYGHLRPGTYDIFSKNYSKFPKKIFVNSNFPKVNLSKKYMFSKQQLYKINIYLKKDKIDISPKKLINYVEQSIKLREYSKFIFSKNVNRILEIIENFANKRNLSLDKVSNLSINDLTYSNISSQKINKKIHLNLIRRKLYSFIQLPDLIKEASNIYVIPHQVSKPNYITNKKVSSNIIQINNFNKNINLKNKIIGIENADPGFDWIFNQKISGLITKYGGANSHMSIRCAELGIPAAIGVGEKIYNQLIKSKKIDLNCNEKKIIFLNN